MKLLITAGSVSKKKFEAIHNEARKVFDEVVINPYGRTVSEAELLELWQGCDAILAGVEDYSAQVLAKAPSTLKVISRHGVGLDTVDVKAAKEKGITVCFTPGANAESVAESALTLILSVLHKIPVSDQAVRTGHWKRPEVHLIKNRTIGILGMGNIGKKLIKMASSLGVSFMAYDPFFDDAFAKEFNVKKASIDEVLSQSDIISLHMPCTDETKYMINKDSIAKMKDGAILINTARGGLVNENDLYNAVKSGKLAGAALDVYSVEPIYQSPLFELENIIFTPHSAGTAMETTMEMGMWALNNAIKVCTGQEGATIVKLSGDLR